MKKLTFIFIVAIVLSFGGIAFAQKAPPTGFYGTNNFTGGATSPNEIPKTGPTSPNEIPKTGATSPNEIPKTGPTSPGSDPEKLDDPLGESVSIEGLLLKLFEIILYVGIPVIAFFLIWSGFMFISAQGNPEKIETAKSRLLYTIIGAILLLGAWTISQAIKGTIEDIKRGGTALYLKNTHISQSVIPGLIRNPDRLT